MMIGIQAASVVTAHGPLLPGSVHGSPFDTDMIAAVPEMNLEGSNFALHRGFGPGAEK